MISLKTKTYEIEEDIEFNGTAIIEDKKVRVEIEASITGDFEIDAEYSSLKDEFIEVTIDNIEGEFDGNSFSCYENFDYDELTGAIKNEFLDYIEEIEEVEKNFSYFKFKDKLNNINLNKFIVQ